jgi:hypothetical protein
MYENIFSGSFIRTDWPLLAAPPWLGRDLSRHFCGRLSMFRLSWLRVVLALLFAWLACSNVEALSCAAGYTKLMNRADKDEFFLFFVAFSFEVNKPKQKRSVFSLDHCVILFVLPVSCKQLPRNGFNSTSNSCSPCLPGFMCPSNSYNVLGAAADNGVFCM